MGFKFFLACTVVLDVTSYDLSLSFLNTLVFICRRPNCDKPAGTAWDTVPAYENISRRQQRSSQFFSAGMPAKLTRVHFDGFSGASGIKILYENVVGDLQPATITQVIAGRSPAYENQAKAS